MIGHLKQRWITLPDWVRLAAWVIAFVIFLELLIPVLGQLAGTHPVLTIVLAMSASYSLFACAVFLDWRHGEDTIQTARERIAFAHLEPDEPMVGVWVILGVCAVVCALVIWAAVEYGTDRGGLDGVGVIFMAIVAALAAPLLLWPTVMVLGLFSPSLSFAATCRFELDSPEPQALARRADIAKMPPPNGLRRPVPVEGEEAWISRSKSLLATLVQSETTIRAHSHADGLAVETRTKGGDREVVTLRATDDRRIEAQLECAVAGLWARGVLRIVRPAGFARMMAALEAARLQRMLGQPVAVRDVALSGG